MNLCNNILGVARGTVYDYGYLSSETDFNKVFGDFNKCYNRLIGGYHNGAGYVSIGNYANCIQFRIGVDGSLQRRAFIYNTHSWSDWSSF